MRGNRLAILIAIYTTISTACQPVVEPCKDGGTVHTRRSDLFNLVATSERVVVGEILEVIPSGVSHSGGQTSVIVRYRPARVLKGPPFPSDDALVAITIRDPEQPHDLATWTGLELGSRW